MNECSIIIFGASGDLVKRKILPALYRLYAQGIVEHFIIVGVAHDVTTIDAIFDNAVPFIEDCDHDIVAQLKKHAYYYLLDFQRGEDYANLKKFVIEQEQKHELPGNRILYLAAASYFFCPITDFSAQTGLVHKTGKKDAVWHRLVYEKPFGHDLASAQKINACIKHYFDETQIFRIDHYLTKEVVSNIALARFTNCVLEPLWNNRYIDNVQIILRESVGVENRGLYYDKYGALCDMVQNHMLELVALIGMESPEWLTGEYIRDERAKVMERIQVIDALRGQYQGYRHEPHVSPTSATETFAAVALSIHNNRWTGVPFYLLTGKYLQSKETVIHIKFKQVDCLLMKHCPSETNYLTIRVTPGASLALTLNVKKPGSFNEVVPVQMEFSHSELFGPLTPEAYEVILTEVMRGEQSIAVRFDEIESCWRVIESINKMQTPLYFYEKGSKGPNELQAFAQKHGMRWRL